jgi:predicted DCC family thiol-disulfide oxidoreductase YuxK
MLNDEAIIVYDGECPFCTSYVKLLRLREAIGPVSLVDARDGGPHVARLKELGYVLDEGMVFVWKGQIFHGADCMHKLSLLSSPSSIFNKANSLVFRSSAASRFLYPMLRAGRNVMLTMLGRRRLRDDERANRPKA